LSRAGCFYYFSDPFYHVATLRRTPSVRATPIRLRRPSKRDKSASADIAADWRLPRFSTALTFRGSPWANRRNYSLKHFSCRRRYSEPPVVGTLVEPISPVMKPWFRNFENVSICAYEICSLHLSAIIVKWSEADRDD